MPSIHLDVSLSLLTFILTVAIPFLTALVSHQFASGPVKAGVTLVLSAIAVLVQAAIAQGGSFDLVSLVISTAVQYFLATGMHAGLLKPAGATGSMGFVNAIFPGGLRFGTPRV